MPYTPITKEEFAKLVGRHGIVGACIESWRAIVATAFNDVLDENDRPNHRRSFFGDPEKGEFRIREDVAFRPGDDVHAADYVPDWWGIECKLGLNATFDDAMKMMRDAFAKREQWVPFPDGWNPAKAPESPEVAKRNAAEEARAKERKALKEKLAQGK